jgi:hypothetical protein
MEKLDRIEVYRLIDGERDYQDNLASHKGWVEGDRTPAKSAADFITLLDVYVNRAKVAYADNSGDEPALDVIRKIAGIAVHCMEINGAPKRNFKH